MPHEEGHAAPATALGGFSINVGGDGNSFPQLRNAPDGSLILVNEDGSFTTVSGAAPETLSPGQIAQLGQQAQSLEQQIAQFAQTHGLDLQEFQLRSDQLAISEQSGRRSDAIQLTGIVASVQGRIDSNLVQFAQMQQAAQSLQTQLNAQAAQAGADRAFSAAQQAANRAVQRSQIIEQARSRNIDQQIQIAGMVADFARDPGDIVANIAAIEQFGSISTALANDFSGLTDEGLAPLDALLDTQAQAQAEGGRLEQEASGLSEALGRALSPTLGLTDVAAPQVAPVQFPTLEQPDLGGLFNAFFEALGGSNTLVEPDGTVQTEGGTDTSLVEANLAERGLTTNELPDFVQASLGLEPNPTNAPPILQPSTTLAIDPNRDQDDPQNPANPPKLSFAHGGTAVINEPTTIEVGENGPEIITAMPVREDARTLLSNAFRKAFEQFRLAAPNIPTFAGGVPPVGVSAPGTSPFIQEAAAGLTAAGSGVKRQLFGEGIARSRATGIRQGVTRRTA